MGSDRWWEAEHARRLKDHEDERKWRDEEAKRQEKKLTAMFSMLEGQMNPLVEMVQNVHSNLVEEMEMGSDLYMESRASSKFGEDAAYKKGFEEGRSLGNVEGYNLGYKAATEALSKKPAPTDDRLLAEICLYRGCGPVYSVHNALTVSQAKDLIGKDVSKLFALRGQGQGSMSVSEGVKLYVDEDPDLIVIEIYNKRFDLKYAEYHGTLDLVTKTLSQVDVRR
jgi:hypothetical protein